MSAYEAWISQNVPGDGYGQCAGVTQAMAIAFPELTRVRGHYYCFEWGQRAHWWLKTPSGQIVDPTSAQFPSGGLGDYIEWREGDKEPTGKCLECGAYCYDGASACSDECLRNLERYYSQR